MAANAGRHAASFGASRAMVPRAASACGARAGRALFFELPSSQTFGELA